MEEFKTVTGLANLGSFALLCFCVVWLTRWIPKRMERADAVREAEATSREKVAESLKLVVETQAKTYILAQERSHQVYAEQTKYEREECNKRIEDLSKNLMETHAIVRQVKHELANIAQVQSSQKAVSEIRGRNKDPKEGVT